MTPREVDELSTLELRAFCDFMERRLKQEARAAKQAQRRGR